MEKRIKDLHENDSLDEDFKGELSLLMPELAYARGRRLIPQSFYNLMKRCLDPQKIDKVLDFKRMVQFLTAIVAYHKMHSKEEKNV